MKKLLLILLGVPLMALFGCGDGNDDEDESQNETPIVGSSGPAGGFPIHCVYDLEGVSSGNGGSSEAKTGFSSNDCPEIRVP